MIYVHNFITFTSANKFCLMIKTQSPRKLNDKNLFSIVPTP